MLEIGGVVYSVDLFALDKLITSKTAGGDKVIETETEEYKNPTGGTDSSRVTTKKYDRVREIDMAKYETVRVLFEVVLSMQDEIDDNLGIDRALADTSLPFKLSFNTLLQYGIIKEEE